MLDVLDVLLPRCCALCRRPGTGLCRSCTAELSPAPDRPAPPDLDDCWALLAYDAATPRLVAELKFRNHRDATSAVGRSLAVYVRCAPMPVDLLTWAPTSTARRHARGYDQAELLARATARAAGTSVAATLRRRSGGPQTGADRAARLAGPSFESTGPVAGHVVVLDDVWTTGATLSAAARTLRSAGATTVSGLVLATRP